MATIEGDDGLPADEVGIWAKQKHDRLRRYLDISRGARRKFLQGNSKSATFIDLFCASGRARVRETGEWIDGSAIGAWKISQAGGAPFSKIYVADIDATLRTASVERLRRLGAPVHEFSGSAVDAAAELSNIVNPHGLHFAFIDPFNLGTLDFRIIQSLARLKRIDMLIHLSAMDLQRNLDVNLGSESDAFDRFSPGWREVVDPRRSQREVRRQVVESWRNSISALGKYPSTRMVLITAPGNQPLYWLLLAANNELAHKFWEIATQTNQGDLF
jgi:three-Cys-motif partner protein